MEPGPELSRVAFVADDFHGIRPRVRVSEGEQVRRGTLLCEDAALSGVRHTAPGAGRIESINRGARRSLESIVIALSETERMGTPSEEELESFPVASRAAPAPAQTRALLVESGLWTAFRTRPFSKVPRPDAVPHAIFVTAIDTNPLAPDPAVVLAGQHDVFELGLRTVAGLSNGKTYLCVRAGSAIPDVDAPAIREEFAGPHPAGLPGVHIHTLAPVSRHRSVWTIGYQDVLSVGHLVRTGHLYVGRVVSIGGPAVANPRLVRTRLGASIRDLARGVQLHPPDDGLRWVSGSVWSGKAVTDDALAYMGRYDLQLVVLREGGRRELLTWLRPGLDKFSTLPVFLPRLRSPQTVEFTTDTHGSRRPIVPLGAYDRLVPMDILPTFLFRALAAGDLERAEELGCLELDEEDLALCSFVDPCKNDFGRMLRQTLSRIESEG
jgi:Na+-transporting NADH:ubiquinone oxidoreductase subunit A